MLPGPIRDKINLTNAERRADLFWTEARTQTLRDCAAVGKSINEATAEIGDGCTRSMTFRRANRLGIKFHGTDRFKKNNRVKWLRYQIAKLQSELAQLLHETEIDSPLLFDVSRETQLVEA